MRVDPLVPDVAPPAVPQAAPGASEGAGAFLRLVDAAGAVFEDASRAEARFVAHRGGLQEMVVERVRADLALQIAASAAQRATQSLGTLLGMQV